MKWTIHQTSASIPVLERRISASRSKLGVIAWGLALFTAFVGLFAVTIGTSWILVQGFGIGILLALGVPLVADVLKCPEIIVRPIYVFFLGCIYFFVLDMALLREVEEFQPETVLVAEMVIVTFLVAVIGTWCLVQPRRTPLSAILKRVDGSLIGNTYFRIALIAFSLEYLRRLYFVGWSFPDLIHDSLLPRGQGAFRRGGVAGGWGVFFQPIEVLFWGVAFFADRAWQRGISRSRKFILLLVVAIQLGTFVLDGVRGRLLMAMALPFFVRAVQRDQSVGQWLRGFALASFLIAPVMDVMVQVRGYGWSEISRVEQVNWNIVQAHRDDNFFWVVNLVNLLQRDRGVLAYKGPFGFIEGIREIGWLWLIMPIPRVFWPDKPLVTEMGDETRGWYATDSIAGSLLRYGGVTFVVLGGVFLGLWLSLLDPLYPSPESDGAAMTYTFLLVITLSIIRGIGPAGVIIPFLLIFVLIVISWGAIQVIQRLSMRLTLRT